ncbi:MAG: DNA-binding protein [archaeon]|nr:DNA-binding protein [archaeon]
MEDPELEALRQKRFADAQASQRQAAAQQQAIEDQRRQIDAQKQAILRRILDPEARDRLGNIRAANPSMAESVEMQLIQLAQSGRIHEVVTDAMLRDILRRISPRHREITIERR